MTDLSDESTRPQETFAIALSGGGSRAMAFHLGCLRSLHKADLLQNVTVISSVSGGSVLAALYCYHNGDFDSFERIARKFIKQGFVGPAIRIAFTTLEGIKALACFSRMAIDRIAAFIVRCFLLAISPDVIENIEWIHESHLRRSASRTTILQRVFSEIFESSTLSKLRSDKPKLIIVACELRNKTAFYFASDGAGSWRLGMADPNNIEIARAVVSSAAYPSLLPALDECMTFKKNGEVSTRRITLTDGGVYDNLGLSPLWPDRSPEISLHVSTYDRLVVSRAGYGLAQEAPTTFWSSRMKSVVYCALARVENLSINRLFDLVKAGKIKGLLLPYLGQADKNLSDPPPDLVTAERVAAYPTNFNAMPEVWIDLLSLRGEQLTTALIEEHWPEFS